MNDDNDWKGRPWWRGPPLEAREPSRALPERIPESKRTRIANTKACYLHLMDLCRAHPERSRQ